MCYDTKITVSQLSMRLSSLMLVLARMGHMRRAYQRANNSISRFASQKTPPIITWAAQCHFETHVRTYMFRHTPMVAARHAHKQKPKP